MLVDMFANLEANGVIVRWERILGAAVRVAIEGREGMVYLLEQFGEQVGFSSRRPMVAFGIGAGRSSNVIWSYLRLSPGVGGLHKHAYIIPHHQSLPPYQTLPLVCPSALDSTLGEVT